MIKAKSQTSGERTHVTKNGVRTVRYPFKFSLTSHHRNMNSRWIKKLHIKSQPLNLLEENTGRYFHDIGTEKNFVNKTQIPGEQK